MISRLNSIYSVILALFYTCAYSHIYIERGEEELIGFSMNDVQKVRKENEAGWILFCVLCGSANRSRVWVE